MTQSRTYKLRLSEEGIDLFLECHFRLARLIREFIPYGVTLSVALTLLENHDPCDVLAELETQRCKNSLGANIRFVGTSIGLVESTKRITDKLLESDEVSSAPSTVSLYVAALSALTSTEDEQIMSVYRQLGKQSKPRTSGKRLFTE